MQFTRSYFKILNNRLNGRAIFKQYAQSINTDGYIKFEFDAKPNIESRLRLKKGVELRRYVRVMAVDPPKFTALVSDICNLEYSAHHRSLVIWALLIENDHRSVKMIYDKLESNIAAPDNAKNLRLDDVIDTDTVIGFMKAFSKLNETGKVIQLRNLLPDRFSIVAVNMFLQSCSSLNHLGATETVLKRWLGLNVSNLFIDPQAKESTDKFLKTFRVAKQSKVTPPRNYSSEHGNEIEYLQNDGVSASDIFDHLNTANIASSELPDIETWNSIVRMYRFRSAWIQVGEIINYLETLDLMSNVPRNGTPKSQGWYLSTQVLQYFEYNKPMKNAILALYHMWVLLLCECDQFRLAMDVLASLEKRGFKLLLKSYRPLFMLLHSNINNSDLEEYRIKETLTSICNAILRKVEDSVKNLSNLLAASPLKDECVWLRDLNDYEPELIESFDKDMVEELSDVPDVLVMLIKACSSGKDLMAAENILNTVRDIEVKYNIRIFDDYDPNINRAFVRIYCDTENWKRALAVSREYNEAYLAKKTLYPQSEKNYHTITEALIRSDRVDELVEYMEQYAATHSIK